MTKHIDGVPVPNDAEDGEFSTPRVMNPGPGDPTGRPSQRWTTVVKGRERKVIRGYN